MKKNMMKKIFFFSVLAAFILTGCEKDEHIKNTDKDGNIIKFGTYISKPTKAISYSNSTFDTFMLYGYKSKSDFNWETAPDSLINCLVTRAIGGANDAWVTSVTTTWPTIGTNVRFFGFYPNDSIYSLTTEGPILSVDNTNQTDYLVGVSGNIVAAELGNPRVIMPFNHIMSKISFLVEVAAGYTVNIDTIEIQGLNKVGTYSFLTDKWSNLAKTAPHGATLIERPLEVNSSSAVNILATDGAIMAIPQSKVAWSVPGKFDPITQCRLRIRYNLKQNSDNTYLIGTETTPFVDAYLPLDLNLDKGDAYTIELTFGNFEGSASGGGGYDEFGNKLFKGPNTIKFTTTFNEWL